MKRDGHQESTIVSNARKLMMMFSLYFLFEILQNGFLNLIHRNFYNKKIKNKRTDSIA